MKLVCDFHIHSKYSRATSKDMDVPNLAKWARIKGIDILGTGDFTHPLWLKELKENLTPAEPGLFKIKNSKLKINNNNNNFLINYEDSNQKLDIRFILTVEISSIYSKNNKTRKIHNLIFAPDFETVEKINAHLGWVGNLKSDGRPILGLDAKELAKIVLGISEDCLIIPCHAWTPWFSIFGSNSGFDSIEECFEEYSKYIYAIETGLSSDPMMNWRLSALDNITLISNSDAHSPSNLGREVNFLEVGELSYNNIVKAIRSPKGDSSKFLMTVEFFPQEGKYHFDGHRKCDICLSPEESKKYKNICPKCKKPLTIGVMHRVHDLADRKPGFKPTSSVPYKSLIPLKEIIADTFGVGVNTKQVAKEYQNLIKSFRDEFRIILDVQRHEIESVSLPEIAEGVLRVREGKVKIEPGHDGEYGKIKIFEDKERRGFLSQKSLF